MKRVLFIVALAAALCGCVYKGGKVTEGTDLSVGINVPSTDGALQFQLLNYLSGFRLAVADNARLTMKYTVNEDNSYFGCISTKVTKTVDAVVEPCTEGDGGGEVEPEPEEGKAEGGCACGKTDQPKLFGDGSGNIIISYPESEAKPAVDPVPVPYTPL